MSRIPNPSAGSAPGTPSSYTDKKALRESLNRDESTASKDDKDDKKLQSLNLTRLHLAAEQGKADMVKDYLDKHPGDINRKDGQGMTALVIAAKNQHREFVQRLLEHGPKPDLADNMGRTALHWESVNGDVDMLKLLLGGNNSSDATRGDEGNDKGPGKQQPQKSPSNMYVDLLDSYLQSGLHLAARSGRADAVRLLLNNRADCRLSNTWGMTPFDGAAIAGRWDVMDVLYPETKSNVPNTSYILLPNFTTAPPPPTPLTDATTPLPGRGNNTTSTSKILDLGAIILDPKTMETFENGKSVLAPGSYESRSLCASGRKTTLSRLKMGQYAQPLKGDLKKAEESIEAYENITVEVECLETRTLDRPVELAKEWLDSSSPSEPKKKELMGLLKGGSCYMVVGMKIVRGASWSRSNSYSKPAAPDAGRAAQAGAADTTTAKTGEKKDGVTNPVEESREDTELSRDFVLAVQLLKLQFTRGIPQRWKASRASRASMTFVSSYGLS